MTTNRFTVIGSKRQVELFQKSNWKRHLRAWFGDLLENSPGRFACQFETESAPLESLKRLSRRSPRLTFLLDYEIEESRIKGLAKGQGAKLDHCEMSY
jgi:hypothetical protein